MFDAGEECQAKCNRKIRGIIGNPFGYNVPDLQANIFFQKELTSGGKWFTKVKDQFKEDEVDGTGEDWVTIILESCEQTS